MFSYYYESFSQEGDELIEFIIRLPVVANVQHIQWLKEGVESWNVRRAKSDFFPDFSGANIPAELQGPLYNPPTIRTDTRLDGINFQNASFSGASLIGICLQGADLRSAQLQHCQMWSTDLSNADLSDSDCSEAVLLCATLSGAETRSVNFGGANLSGANLEGIDLTHSDLTNANLVRSKISSTDFSGTKLIGVDITDTKPWSANLFREVDDDYGEYELGFDRIDGVKSLVEICLNLEKHYRETDCGEVSKRRSLYFRGQYEDQWSLTPSIMRKQKGESKLRRSEGEMLLELMSQRPDDFVDVSSALSQWVLAQHHGLKTRLLDITTNPLVALFHCCDSSSNLSSGDETDGTFHIFAVPKQIVKTFDSDTIRIISNFSKLPRFEQDVLLGKEMNLQEANQRHVLEHPNRYVAIMERLYNYIGHEKPYFQQRIDLRDFFRVFVVKPQQSFERLRSQSGAFMISAFHEEFETDAILQLTKNVPIYHHYKITVPASKKKNILHELEILNVTKEMLFPGLDESSKAIVRRYMTE